ncbi:MAG: two-component regulator propeller domain-containing protein [Mangrovibacterium sp.]
MLKAYLHSLLFFIFVLGTSAQTNISFLHYGIEKGLTESKINGIAQDSIGFIWLASDNSLTRFDGNHFKTYKNTDEKQPALPVHQINTVFSDSNGKIWIGTEHGAWYYDHFRDRFLPMAPGWDRIRVTDFAEGVSGEFWIATDEGLAMHNRKTGETNWFTDTGTVKTPGNDILPNSNINHICRQPDGDIWLATFPNGVYRLNPQTREITAFRTLGQTNLDQLHITNLRFSEGELLLSTLFDGFFIIDPNKGLVNNYIFENLTQDVHHFDLGRDSIIWLASNSGLIRFDRKSNTARRFTNVPTDPFSLERTAVIYVFADKDNNLWTSSGIRGINYGLNNIPFQHFLFDDGTPYTLTHKEVTAISFDHAGNMWLGYESGLIERHSSGPYRRKSYRLKTNRKDNSSGAIFKLFEDSRNQLWALSWSGGLQKMNAEGTDFTWPPVKPEAAAAVLHTADIRDIVEDANGNLWLTLHGKGLWRYHPDTHEVSEFRYNENDIENSLSNDYIFDLCLDTNQDLWISSSHGVSRLNTKTGRFTNYFHNEGNPSSLASNTIQTIYCDHSGVVWAGTNNGLNIFMKETGTFLPVQKGHDIAYLNISSIRSVKPGEIWVSTKSGVFRLTYSGATSLETLDYTIDYFNQSYGLISSIYFERSAAVDGQGTIYFGGNEGVDFFHPNQVPAKKHSGSGAILTEIAVYGKPVLARPNEEDRNIPVVELDYNQQMITFRFTSLNFVNPGKQKYRYKLIGFDQEWVYTQQEQVATYTRLKPGTYFFQVETTTPTGQWDNRSSLVKLKVHPPFWMTFPFLAISLIVLGGSFFLIQHAHTRRLMKRQHELEKIIAKRTRELVKNNQELVKANLTKNKLFSIVSHDLRSPFSGLLGMLDLLTSEDETSPDEQANLLKLTNDTAINIYNLLDNLLLWANTQMDKISYRPARINLKDIVNENIQLVRERAKLKSIQIEEQLPREFSAFADYNMINTVVRNLMSNAVKFTHPGGTISILGEIRGTDVLVNIADSGIGLSPKQLQHLFELGETSRDGTSGEKGTGLGLLICQEFIAKNHGKIWATHNYPQGTVFHFTIPTEEQKIPAGS